MKNLIKGFTLIELLVVLVIVSLLTVLSYRYYGPVKIRAYNVVALIDMRNIRTAMEAEYADYLRYPSSIVKKNKKHDWLSSKDILKGDVIDFVTSKNIYVYYKANSAGSIYLCAVKHLQGNRVYLSGSKVSKTYYMENSLTDIEISQPKIISLLPPVYFDDKLIKSNKSIWKSL